MGSIPAGWCGSRRLTVAYRRATSLRCRSRRHFCSCHCCWMEPALRVTSRMEQVEDSDMGTDVYKGSVVTEPLAREPSKDVAPSSAHIPEPEDVSDQCGQTFASRNPREIEGRDELNRGVGSQHHGGSA